MNYFLCPETVASLKSRNDHPGKLLLLLLYLQTTNHKHSRENNLDQILDDENGLYFD